MCELAGSKDGGFSREWLVAALAHFDKIPARLFDGYTDDYELLRHCVVTARRALQASERDGPSLDL